MVGGGIIRKRGIRSERRFLLAPEGISRPLAPAVTKSHHREATSRLWRPRRGVAEISGIDVFMRRRNHRVSAATRDHRLSRHGERNPL